MKRINIAIDGYSSCGKSTTARFLAKSLAYVFIDSGAMYRAVTWYLQQAQIQYTDTPGIIKALSEIHLAFLPVPESELPLIHLNGECVETYIRHPSVSNEVSEYSTVKEIREVLVHQQQLIGKNGGVVMDGRDIGTVVFPEAELKIFLTADLDIRVKRRALELKAKATEMSEADIRANLLHRDFVDMNRQESPLRKAEDAIEIDTSHLTIEEQVLKVKALAEKIMLAGSTENLVNS